MRPLKTSQRILTWLFVCQPGETISDRKKMAMFLSGLVIIIANVGSMSCATVFFINELKIDLEESLYALFQISAVYFVIYMQIMGFFSRQKIGNMFDNLTELYGTCKIFSRLSSMMVILFSLIMSI